MKISKVINKGSCLIYKLNEEELSEIYKHLSKKGVIFTTSNIKHPKIRVIYSGFLKSKPQLYIDLRKYGNPYGFAKAQLKKYKNSKKVKTFICDSKFILIIRSIFKMRIISCDYTLKNRVKVTWI